MNEKINITIQRLKNNKPLVGVIVSIVIVVSVITYTTGFYSGKERATIMLEGEKVNYENIDRIAGYREKDLEHAENKIVEIQEEIKKYKDEREAIYTEVSENKEAHDEAMKIIENKNAILEEIKTLESELVNKKGEISKLDSNIEAKKSELASVTGQILEKNEAPKQLSAGNFIVGKDIPSGRYKVVPVGRGGNFFVDDSVGSSIANVIISSINGHGVPEYIMFLEDGYTINAKSPFKYIPVN